MQSSADKHFMIASRTHQLIGTFSPLFSKSLKRLAGKYAQKNSVGYLYSWVLRMKA
jgi:hypothetical protein